MRNSTHACANAGSLILISTLLIWIGGTAAAPALAQESREQLRERIIALHKKGDAILALEAKHRASQAQVAERMRDFREAATLLGRYDNLWPAPASDVEHMRIVYRLGLYWQLAGDNNQAAAQ